MPAANQAPLGVTRIRSTGLPHSVGGAGISISSIRKSPLAASVDAADNVPNHVREAAVRVGGTRHVRYRNITDGSLESHQRIIGYYRRSKGSSYEDHKNRCKQTLFHNFTFISFPLFSFIFLSFIPG